MVFEGQNDLTVFAEPTFRKQLKKIKARVLMKFTMEFPYIAV